MSFDPRQIATLRMIAPQVPRGMVAERHHRARSAGTASPAAKDALGLLAQSVQRRPQFIAYSVADLPATHADGRSQDSAALPLLTWTVRSAERPRARPRATPTR